VIGSPAPIPIYPDLAGQAGHETLRGSRVDRERLLLVVDRIAAGRWATHRVGEAVRSDPRTSAVFARTAWLLLAAFVIGAGAVVEAVARARAGDHVTPLVWWRLVVILAIASTLFYFVWRASLGFWWAYSRLRLFSLVFPVIAVGSSLVPGLYPEWMVVEQVLFSAVLLLVRWVLSAPHLRLAYARPQRPAAPAVGS
jgi:hypothetical protein